MKLQAADIITFGKLFKIGLDKEGEVSNDFQGKTRKMRIPAYQRPYRWKEENIENMFDDYNDACSRKENEEDEAEYFLGAAVAVDKKKEKKYEYDIVDGQQRITTLFLLNYVRFLLKREYIYHMIITCEDNATLQTQINEMYDIFADYIVKNCEDIFDNLKNKQNETFNEVWKNPDKKNELMAEFQKCFEESFGLTTDKESKEATRDAHKSDMSKFLSSFELSIHYARKRYDELLLEALESVYIHQIDQTKTYKLIVIDEEMPSKNYDYYKTYTDALKKIFEKVWKVAEKKTDKVWDRVKFAIGYIEEMLTSMKLCFVVTDNADDANVLFEVLNDRSLEVQDLELIKNHYYKEYCTKSKDSENNKDKTIEELDEIWNGEIFTDQKEENWISYLTTIYITQNYELDNKNGVKFKENISEYTNGFYGINKEYKKEDITRDFRYYYAIKILIKEFDIVFGKQYAKALTAENGDKSITYKSIHLINALGQMGVIAALINVIISNYEHLYGKGIDIDQYKSYLDSLRDDSGNNNSDYLICHRCADVLTRAALLSKDQTGPRKIAKEIIKRFGAGYKYERKNDIISDFDLSFDFEVQIGDSIYQDFPKWIDEWKFDKNINKFRAKILFFRLLSTQRQMDKDESRLYPQKAKLIKNQLSYKLDSSKLELDHLEPNSGKGDKYFDPSNVEERNKIVNGEIGNFMILDTVENNNKNNKPLCKAMKYYKKIDKSWLIRDINLMIEEDDFFDKGQNAPKKEFFYHRTKLLTAYFEAILKCKFSDTEVDVVFDL